MSRTVSASASFTMSLRFLLGEVRQRAGQPVDLVDHDDVDLARLNVGEQQLQAGAFQRPAGEAAIVIMSPDELPALMGLALDVGLCRLALGIERVKVLFEAMLGGLPGIDGATKDFPLVRRHGLSPVSCRSPRAFQKTGVHSSSCR